MDCFLVDLFWALQILYEASFKFSPSLCLKLRTSRSGVLTTIEGLAMTTHETQEASEKEANRKRGRIKQQGWSGGEENERQMANNVMRGIRVVMGTWYVLTWSRLPGNGARNGLMLEDQILTWLGANLPGKGTRNPSCYLLSMCRFSFEDEMVMQQSSVSISLSFWEPRYQSSRRLHASHLVPAQTIKNLATNAINGLSIPSRSLHLRKWDLIRIIR